MKTADLKTGTEYAYKPHSYSTPTKVTVLVPAFDGRAKVRRGFSDRTERVKGVKVEFKGGATEVVRPQTLVSTWAEHQKQKRASQRYAREAAARKAAELQTAAETVVALDGLLRSKGAKVHPGAYCYRDEQQEALRAAGMPPASRDDDHEEMAEGYEDEYVGDPNHFSSVFYALDDALKGHFDLDVLALLVPPCFHEDCSDCGKKGKPCGRSRVGQPGHEECVGVQA